MIEIVDTDTGLAGLFPEWDALWQRMAGATPFQSPRWLLPWWRQFGTGLARVAVERSDGGLVGLLPMYVLPEERKVLPIGAGPSDYLDALGDPAALLPALLARVDGEAIDHCDLIEVRPEAALRQASAPGWRAAWSEHTACPVLALSDIPSGIKRKLRMSRHRAERQGGWSVEIATDDTVPALLSELFRLHRLRWGEVLDAGIVAMLTDATPLLQAGGLLRLAVLRVGNQTVAAILALLAPGRIFFYLSGYDEAQSFVSPGTLLLGAMLEQAIGEGRSEAHFLRGREGYKYAWGAVDRLNWAGRFTRDQR